MTPADLRTFRRQRGLTQAEAAERLGYTVTQWGRWERGVSPVPHAVALAIGYVTLTGQWRFPPVLRDAE